MCHYINIGITVVIECNISVLADSVYKDSELSLDTSTTLQLDTNKLAINIILAMKVGAILLLVAVSASYAAVFSGRNAGTFNFLLHHPRFKFSTTCCYYIHWIICLLIVLTCTLEISLLSSFSRRDGLKVYR